MATTQLSRTSAKRSTVVLKYAMAISGLLMLGYLLIHMYGNLKFFQGQKYFDSYLKGLGHLGVPYLPEDGALWLLRITLLVALVVHVYSALTLWRRNKTAAGYVGGKRYYTNKNRAGVQRSYASFTMRWGGIILLLFIIGHVAQMMPNWLAPGGASDSKYERVVNGFELWWVVLLYTIGLVAVGFHLQHGFWSAFATLGFNRSASRNDSMLMWISTFIAALICFGFLIVPYAILLFGVGT